ncbi:hypothetical protein KIW84_011450 [Lathyrus oleraceus]|uniref:Reverse transcriptase domain-containing protein n=1 Tax=Pisum sativum TaxID=3888 RepID=A0A9D5GUY9_PEA|nr:hypothetical protein KIW84_011450 [Pisum sativum]
MPKKKVKKIVICWKISQVVETRGEGDSAARGAMRDCYSKHRRGYARSSINVVVHKLPWREDCPLEKQNAGATYQRAMVTLFHDMIHHEIECYVDDMIAKSQIGEGHLADLAKLNRSVRTIQTEAARRLRQYMLVHATLWMSKMDPIKYVFEKPALTGRVAKEQKNVD